uniref:Uncharacterized protein n=1 Tax=Romanomermis culicivorax TaxID=13658 RepID=A0A915L2T7_ROMCU
MVEFWSAEIFEENLQVNLSSDNREFCWFNSMDFRRFFLHDSTEKKLKKAEEFLKKENNFKKIVSSIYKFVGILLCLQLLTTHPVRKMVQEHGYIFGTTHYFAAYVIDFTGFQQFDTSQQLSKHQTKQ